MKLTDFCFLCSFAVILVLYYVVPYKYRWGVLFVSSIAYYLFAGHPLLILYPLASVILIYVLGRKIAGCTAGDTERSVKNPGKADADGADTGVPDDDRTDRRRRLYLLVGICALLTILIILKYLKFVFAGRATVLPDGTYSVTEILVPLGLSYYTFTLIGYLVDVYNGIAEPADNIFKFITFGMYAPALSSGPIMKYREVAASFYEDHPFDIDRIARGCQRILWGFFKKVVIADRLNVIVASVYDLPIFFSGPYIWIAMLGFTFQLYADFSGLMDIVLGISECFGLKLPENFNTPFLAHTISEYWRRWHITLGVWFKEYVFYPLLRSKVHTTLQSKLKDKFGKKTGKRLSTFAAMFILWSTVGLWHGGNMTYVIGSGLLHWFYIVLEECFEEPFKKLWNALHIDPATRFLNCVRIVRTFIFVNIGNVFFRSASVRDALLMFKYAFDRPFVPLSYVIDGARTEYAASGIEFIKDFEIMGLGLMEIVIVLISLIILIVVDVLRTKMDIRARLAACPLIIRFIIWFALLMYVILLGSYGPGFDSAAFIYQGF